MSNTDTRVLVVDDSLVARSALIRQLRELGFTAIVEAKDGEQAFQLLIESRAEKKPFGLIITDLLMPKVSGLELLGKINEAQDFKTIPKLITSVETERGTVLNAVMSGADGYILKPSTTPTLKLKLEKILHKSKAADSA